MDRRDYLKTAGIVGSAGILGTIYATTRNESPDNGGDARPTAAPTTDTGTESDGNTSPSETEPDSDPPEETADRDIPHAEQFETVINAVEEGADPDGEERNTFLFEEYAANDTLLAFEPGTYKIDYFTVSGNTHVGVVGSGEEPATFVPANGDCRGGHPWVAFDGVSDLLLENVRFDFRGMNSGGPVHLLVRGETTVRDVTYLGSCSNQIAMFKIAVRDPAGTARFERVEARNVGENHSLTGIFVTSDHAGELTFHDCTLEMFSDNGLYASAPGLPDGRDGRVDIIGGTYKNNNVANLRLGSTGSRAENVTVVVDAETPGWGRLNARGIRLRNRAEQIIENCTITFGADAADSFGGIVFHPDNGGALVRDTTITINRDSIPAIRTFPIAKPGTSAPTFENLSITGSAATGVTARIEGRDNTVFENCTIEQTGANRSGIHFIDSTECRVIDSHLDVSKQPIAVTNGTVTIENSTINTPDGEIQVENELFKDETLTFE